MKKQDLKQLKEKATAELEKDLKANLEKLRDLKLAFAAGKVKNISAIKEDKKLIARILTIVNSRKQAEKLEKPKA